MPNHVSGSAGDVLERMQRHRNATPSNFVPTVMGELRKILKSEIKITPAAFTKHVTKLKYRISKLGGDSRKKMVESIQTGILQSSCKFSEVEGYILVNETTFSLGDGAVDGKRNRDRSAQLPGHMWEAGPDIRAILLPQLHNFISPGVDLPNLKILVAKQVITMPTKGNKVPKGCFLMEGDWAIFRRIKTKNNDVTYVLDALWLDSPPRDLQKMGIVTWALAQLHRHGKLMVTYRTRKGSTNEVMRCYGVRWAGQASKRGTHVGRHCWKGVVAVGEEAVAACVMTKAVQVAVKPLFGMYLLNTMERSLSNGGNFWPSKFPWTVSSLTRNYYSRAHRDKQDTDDSLIFWLEDKRDGGTIEGAAFVLSTHGVYAVPKHGSALYLRTPVVEHMSVAPRTTGDAGLLGVGLAVNKSVVTRLTDLQDKAIAKVSDGGRNKMLLTLSDIPEEWRSIDAIEECIGMADN